MSRVGACHNTGPCGHWLLPDVSMIIPKPLSACSTLIAPIFTPLALASNAGDGSDAALGAEGNALPDDGDAPLVCANAAAEKRTAAAASERIKVSFMRFNALLRELLSIFP